MDSRDIILYDPKTLEGMAMLGNSILEFFKGLFCGDTDENKSNVKNLSSFS